MSDKISQLIDDLNDCIIGYQNKPAVLKRLLSRQVIRRFLGHNTDHIAAVGKMVLPQGTVIKRVTVGVMRGNNHVSATAGTYAEALEMVTEKLEEYGQ